jgi:DNA-binding IclR family transcriptional regulator
MSQYAIVKAIDETDGPCPLDQLQREIDCSTSTLHSLLNRLERKSIVTRSGIARYDTAEEVSERDLARMKPTPLGEINA